ncbi:hypothetical protein EV421DRAFT_1743468 [Armillaria borealis]|uniref:Uncharacterized protein n=1 Tax=Armillaria borealis TaxID=47425 RepID=A0AA39MEN6_9AGAR|nr:hypothetical protein EV421DRAFT_1743468 [Armillaria borealis]
MREFRTCSAAEGTSGTSSSGDDNQAWVIRTRLSLSVKYGILLYCTKIGVDSGLISERRDASKSKLLDSGSDLRLKSMRHIVWDVFLSETEDQGLQDGIAVREVNHERDHRVWEIQSVNRRRLVVENFTSEMENSASLDERMSNFDDVEGSGTRRKLLLICVFCAGTGPPTGGSDDETQEVSLVLNVAHHTSAPSCDYKPFEIGRCAFKNALGSSATYHTPEYILAHSTNVLLRLQTAQSLNELRDTSA